ncbi:MAG: hypothetical protein IJU41_09210 [Clostridia bacterium]|nr:hypothetical protein [Clostridia bacterium]
MNTSFRPLAKALCICATVFALLGAAARLYMLFALYDIENGFYTSALAHSLFRACGIAIAAVFFAIGHIYIKEENEPVSLPENSLTKWTSYLCGGVLGGFLLYSLVRLALDNRLSIATGFACLFAVFGLLYFFTANAKGDFHALLCISNALLILAIVFGVYFDRRISYVNHSGALFYAAAVFVMLSLLAECNFNLGRSAYRRFCSYAPTAAVLTVSLALPDIVYAIAFRRAVVLDVYYDILLLTYGVYCLVRLFTLALDKTEKTK